MPEQQNIQLMPERENIRLMDPTAPSKAADAELRKLLSSEACWISQSYCPAMLCGIYQTVNIMTVPQDEGFTLRLAVCPNPGVPRDYLADFLIATQPMDEGTLALRPLTEAGTLLVPDMARGRYLLRTGRLDEPGAAEPVSLGLEKKRKTIWAYILAAASVAAIVVSAPFIAYQAGSSQSHDPKRLAALLGESVIEDVRESKSIPVALRWSQFARSLGDQEQVKNAGTALLYAVEETGGDVIAQGPDGGLVVPIGAELFLLGYYNQDKKAEAEFFRLAESVWRKAEPKHRLPAEAFMGLANCCKARNDWDQAQKYLDEMLKAPNMNKADKARGENFKAWVLTKRAEKAAPSDPRRETWLAEAKRSVTSALESTGGGYAKAYVNLFLVLQAQAGREDGASARKALDDGVNAAKKKLSTPGLKGSTRLWFTLAILHSYQGREEDALKAFKKARDNETRDFVATIWARTEPAFDRLSQRARKLMTDKGPEQPRPPSYVPMTMSVIWDEELLLPADPTGAVY